MGRKNLFSFDQVLENLDRIGSMLLRAVIDAFILEF